MGLGTKPSFENEGRHKNHVNPHCKKKQFSNLWMLTQVHWGHQSNGWRSEDQVSYPHYLSCLLSESPSCPASLARSCLPRSGHPAVVAGLPGKKAKGSDLPGIPPDAQKMAHMALFDRWLFLWSNYVSLPIMLIYAHSVSLPIMFKPMLIMLFLHPNQMPRSENVLEKDHSLDSFLTEKLETEEGLHHSCKQKHFDFPNSLTGERPWILPMDGYHFPGGAGCVWILVHSIYHFLNLVLAAYIQGPMPNREMSEAQGPARFDLSTCPIVVTLGFEGQPMLWGAQCISTISCWW